MFVGALVAEIRPSARPVKVVVGQLTTHKPLSARPLVLRKAGSGSPSQGTHGLFGSAATAAIAASDPLRLLKVKGEEHFAAQSGERLLLLFLYILTTTLRGHMRQSEGREVGHWGHVFPFVDFCPLVRSANRHTDEVWMYMK